jgi:TetR/AcrR family transcriptional regulator
MARGARKRRTTRRPGARGRISDGSRDRLFDAACAEFAARGFAGASVDRIAALARLNKAMIYYHFSSKAALYQEILRDMFSAVRARVQVVADSPIGPEEKVRQFVTAIAAEAEARPHFPPIWFREIAEGGTHLDDATLQELAAVVRTLGDVVEEGVRRGRFKRASTLLVHSSIVAPLLLFFASTGIRRRLERAGLAGAAQPGRDEVVGFVSRLALGVLQGRV